MASPGADVTICSNIFALMEEIYDRYFPSLVAYARKIVSNTNAAEDIVADAFLRVMSIKETFRNNEELIKYTWTVVKTGCINYKRNGYRQSAVYRELLITSNQSADPNSEIEEIARRAAREKLLMKIEVFLERLPPKSRKVIKKSYFQNMSEREIAEEMGISVHTVKRHKQEVKGKLKKELGISLLFLLFCLLLNFS